MSRDIVLGLDLGQVTEHSALVVVEGERKSGVFSCAVRYLHQFPIGTDYAEIAAVVGQVVREGSLGSVPLVLDVTSVGPGIVPVFRNFVRPAWIETVQLTAGGTAAKDENDLWRIPKRDLVTAMQILLQGERLKVAGSLPNADLLVNELKTFRTNLPVSTNPDTLDWRERPHDDLVLATAIACWWSQRHPPYVPGSIVSGGNEELHEMLNRVFPELKPKWLGD